MKDMIKIALAGNPNAGKTTIFNNITGSRQHVGNYPGVTVEYKEGEKNYQGNLFKVIDLPGTYSLTTYSMEEKIAREFLLNEKPDVVVDILDSSNLERNLYLAMQLIELEIPLILAFNMSDIAASRGMTFDIGKISKMLGVPIVPMTGSKNEGTDALLDKVLEVAQSEDLSHSSNVKYDKIVEEQIKSIESVLVSEYDLKGMSTRWLAIKFLENDEEIQQQYNSDILSDTVHKSLEKLYSATQEAPESLLASQRYDFISNLALKTVRSTKQSANTISDKIDSVVTHRIWGIPLFLGLMYLVFWFTFTVGDPFMGWIETGFEWLSGFIAGFWAPGSESALKSLIIDGIIGGVGGVLVFLPNILLLFLAISILEDSGYMARAAFIMDRLMQKIGLPGKSFIPMLIGFGCSVPAIMATRTLDNKRDRLVTMLVVPLMSCGARLPIYALIIPAFFPQVWHAPMLWIIYLTGIILAILSAFVLRKTLLKGESVPFIMELPSYKFPTVKGLLMHAWQRGWLYVKKAGTIILGISILLWFMTTYPKKQEFSIDYTAMTEQIEQKYENTDNAGMEEEILELQNAQQAEELSYTVAGRIGHAIEPVISTMGFDWKIGTALIGAFAAKEVFVAQLGIVYSIGEADEDSDSLRDQLKKNYTPLIGLAIMLFCLISAPCMATIAITKRESNSWKWALFQLGGLTLLAWVFTTLVYQIGLLLGF